MTPVPWRSARRASRDRGWCSIRIRCFLAAVGIALASMSGCTEETAPAAKSAPPHTEQGQMSDRALLIGVGDYADDAADLSGIDIDLEMMHEFAANLGFRDDQIQVIADAEATQKGVEAAIEDWLVAGTGPADRAMLYFSGHGSQVRDVSGDEDDGLDEFLVLHDFDATGGAPPGTGMLLDDQVNAYLGRIRARETLLIVDACHSGTSYKGLSRTKGFGELDLQVKHYRYPGMPAGRGGKLLDKAGHQPVAVGGRFVGLFAADDTELSRASEQGSIFTLGLLDALRTRLREGGDVTPRVLIDGATAFIEQELEPDEVFHPQLGGDKQLQVASLEVVRPQSERGPRWREAEAIVQSADARIEVLPGSSVTRIGKDNLTLSVEIPDGGGYLNVIEIGDDDEPTLLFPNAYHADNRVGPQARTFRFPTPQMGFELQTTGPAGDNLIVAVVTREPLNLFESGYKTSKDLFASPTQLGLSTLAKAVSIGGHRPVAAGSPSAPAGHQPTWAGMTQVEVTE